MTGGTVNAVVTIGKFGKAAKIETVSSDPNIADEVKNYLASSTTYSEACEGKQVEVMFTFKLYGEPELDPPVSVRFRPPNHFLIISRPQKPIVDQSSQGRPQSGK